MPGEASETLCVVAGPADGGERVDRFLAARIGTLSRSRVKTLIEAGQVWRDGAALAEPAEPVRPGAAYTVRLPPVRPATPQPQALPLAILFEDDDILVIDKPPGLVVHPAPGNEDGTLVNAVLAHCGAELGGIGGERRPGIVHRLDKDTSGVMVVAKTEAAMMALSAAFARRDLERAYLALCWGVPAPPRESGGWAEIAGAIGRDPRDRKRMALRPEGRGKPALTRYRIRRVFHHAATLLECRLASGRTHQIRVHLAGSGHPIVGDPLYLRRVPSPARALPEDLRAILLDFPRQALHAIQLGFVHPRTKERLVFETAPPADMQALLAALAISAGGDK
ncbi:MAG: RluA family pseudouridine synthase [Acetobacteraceae bacterium]|nr:RluA family pseudouridine synthase [Acetobacteraceae bacterium]